MGKGWRVVVVSRHPYLLQRVSSTLGGWWGMQVTCCSMVGEARQVIQHENPQLVFCDDKLADGTFSDLLEPKQLRNPSSPTRVVVLPGPDASLDPDFKWHALERGAYAVLGPTVQDLQIEWVAIRAIREDAQKRMT